MCLHLRINHSITTLHVAEGEEYSQVNVARMCITLSAVESPVCGVGLRVLQPSNTWAGMNILFSPKSGNMYGLACD